MNKVSAVVVTYNRIELLKECLNALKGQSYPCDILVVDNASTDGTDEYIQTIKSKYNNLYYKNTEANIGGAGGFNFGMRWAVEEGYEYVWVMDDDCLPYSDALQKLIEADGILKENYGWIASAVLRKDGHECKMNRVKLKKSFYEYLEYMQYGIVQAEQATFVSLFLKAKTIKEAGLPIKEFFIWGDDIEYTRRISVRMKLPCFIAGKSKVIHAMKENTGSNIATDIPERIDRYKYAFRNEAYLYRQEGWKGICYYFAKCSWNLLKIIISNNNEKIRRSYVLIKSVLVGIFFKSEIEYVLKGEENDSNY